jgi:hypothetical protein
MANKRKTPASSAAPTAKVGAKVSSLQKALLVSVIALVAIEHDGERYEKDDEFTVSPKQAKQLADVNAVKVLGDVADEELDDDSENTGAETDSENSNVSTDSASNVTDTPAA